MTDLQTLRSVLELLPEPALIIKDGTVQWCSPAAAELPVSPGNDAAPLLPDAPLPEEGASLHWDALLNGTSWELSARRIGDCHLLLFHRLPAGTDRSLLTAARGIQPALEALTSAGSGLFGQLEELENEQIQAATATMTRAIFRLLRCAGDLNAFDRLQQENAPLCRERCELAEFFRELAERAADCLLDAGICLEYQGLQSAVHGFIDREEVQRAVLHLLSFATLADESGSPVLLKVSAGAKQLRVSVCCQYEMEEHLLATAFSPYSRATSTDPRQDMGLGLPLVQALARRHGGSVLISSRNGRTELLLCLDTTRPNQVLNTPKKDLSGGYDPCLVILSPTLPSSTYDSRNVEL